MSKKQVKVIIKKKKAKPRSPKYPSITLERAAGHVLTIYDREGKSESATSIVLQQIGYSERSGAGFTTLAALRGFGLVEGRHGTCRLTSRALDIAIAPRDSEPYLEAIQEAALFPDIHRDIWEKYDGELPSDATLRYYLERERGFTATAIKQFIPQLRSTLEFAGLRPGQKVAGTAEDDMDEGLKIEAPLRPKGTAKAVQQATFPLEEGMVTLTWPTQEMSKDSFDDLAAWLDVALRRIARSAGVEHPRKASH